MVIASSHQENQQQLQVEFKYSIIFNNILDSVFFNNTGFFFFSIENENDINSKKSPNIRYYSHLRDGGAIFASNENLLVSNSYFKFNTANRGGGIFFTINNLVTSQSIIIIGCIFIENEVANHGGGISIMQIQNNFNGVISSSYFISNFAYYCKIKKLNKI